MLVASESTLIGRVIAGRFRVVSFIGEGAMAVVYRAEQAREPRAVALKVMRSELAHENAFLRRFRHEAKAVARLSHPGVARLVDYGVDDGLAYIAMELVSGVDLFALVNRLERLPSERALRILLGICEPLVAAHDRGVLHRDLKPENVMLVVDPETSEEHVKVLDFGIAKMVEQQPASLEDAQTSVTGASLTAQGSVLGTPEYMSPEQCQGQRVDFRSDIYAAGVLLYQLVTGTVPFSGKSPVHTMLSHVRERPRLPSALAPGVHPALERLILRMLAKQPIERPQSFRELRTELRELVALIAPEARPRRAEAARAPGTPGGSDDALASCTSPLPAWPSQPTWTGRPTVPADVAGTPAEARGHGAASRRIVAPSLMLFAITFIAVFAVALGVLTLALRW